MPKKLCILTPDPGYYENWQPMADQYRALFGAALSFRSWAAPGDLSGFDLVLPLLAWGYQRDAAQWFRALEAWETADLPMANPVPLLRWNTDKRYLGELAEKGVSTVPTLFTEALTEGDLTTGRARFDGEIIIKPAISGGADGTYRLAADDTVPQDVAGQTMLIQPMMAAITEEGEYSLFYFGGQFSHAIRKAPLLKRGEEPTRALFKDEHIQPREPSAQEREVAAKVLAALPFGPLVYARVDLLPSPTGPQLLELELTEPSVFLPYGEGAGARFAQVLAENLAAESFALDAAQMAAISALDRHRRFNDPGVFGELAFGTFFPIFD